LLIGLFGFAALQAVIMNKAMSLIVIMTTLPARLLAVPFDTVNGYWFVASFSTGGECCHCIEASGNISRPYRVRCRLPLWPIVSCDVPLTAGNEESSR
jgi:hypothetical protein